MPALPAHSGREVVKAFSKDGWQMVRQRGSHMIMVKEGHMATLSVPDHCTTKYLSLSPPLVVLNRLLSTPSRDDAVTDPSPPHIANSAGETFTRLITAFTDAHLSLSPPDLTPRAWARARKAKAEAKVEEKAAPR